MQRRLAAIFSADVQGYSRLMGEDEAGTVRTLTAYRELIASLVEENGGRVVDAPGDNLLAEFPSAVDALTCSAAVQNLLALQNESLSAGRRMQFRIGINVGDVIADGERIYGDGVNIAARVQALADAGGICISGATYDQVEDKLPLAYESIGEHEVKNIVKPVRVYRVGLSVDARPPASEELVPPGIPSIAVLPFDNMSTDPDQGYFSDGIVEDLITDLAKLSGLFVIARNSSFFYKGKAVKVQQVGRELGVGYVLEGSVRKSGDRVRITGQLIDAATGHHVWADRYDRRLDDVFAVQDEITSCIVAALAIKLTGSEQPRSRRHIPHPQAYDLVLRGMDHLRRATAGTNADARDSFAQAIEFDADYAEAHALLAHTYFRAWTMGWWRDPATLDVGLRYAERALALDALLAAAHRSLGSLLLWKKQHEAARAAVERAVALSPHDAHSHFMLAEVLLWTRPAQAIAPVRKAMRLNPRYPAPYPAALGHVFYLLRQYDEAHAALESAIALNPHWMPAHAYLSAVFIEQGRMTEGRAAMAAACKMSPDVAMVSLAPRLPYQDPAVLARVMEAFREAGLQEFPPVPRAGGGQPST